MEGVEGEDGEIERDGWELEGRIIFAIMMWVFWQARQQAQSMESEMVRLKVGQESLEEARRLQATMAADRDAEQSTMAKLIRETANTSAAVHGSVHQISATQNETAKLTSDAAKRLAEVTMQRIIAI